MRMFVISLVILAILIGSGIVYTNVIDNICTDMMNQSDNLAAAVSDRDGGEALVQSEIIGGMWSEKEKVLAVLVDHKYLGEIKSSIGKIHQNLIFSNFDLAAQNTADLKNQLSEIHGMWRINLANIF